jgi:hypothetical protein
MSNLGTLIYGALFVLAFPALWLVAAYWDRTWPTTSELLARHESAIMKEIPE